MEENDTDLNAQSLSALQTEVARKIVGFIEDGRWAVGDRISDAALARELGISRTPVRQVLQLLANHEIVAQAPSRGFQLQRALEPDENLSAIIPPSDIESLYVQIMIARANGQVGDEASEAELSEQFSANRGAIRKALMRLSAEGLAERRPGHGWRFAECLDNAEAINESYAFRTLVECGALLEQGFAADADQFAALERQQRQLLEAPIAEIRGPQWFEANANFHETIVSWSGNRFLVQAIRRQNNLRRMTEYAEFTQLSESGVRKAARDHLGILEAIAAGDTKFAAAILHKHLSRTAPQGNAPHSLD